MDKLPVATSFKIRETFKEGLMMSLKSLLNESIQSLQHFFFKDFENRETSIILWSRDSLGFKRLCRNTVTLEISD